MQLHIISTNLAQLAPSLSSIQLVTIERTLKSLLSAYSITPSLGFNF